jgi:UDP-2,4-diacetamido-2,4,6-trideoxy-beta-L-altropyranose hydrolase
MRAKGLILLVFADANRTAGSGHLMRCFALGQAWKEEGGEVVFFTECESDGLLSRLVGEGFRVLPAGGPGCGRSGSRFEDRLELLRGVKPRDGSWVVADGYQFDAGFFESIKAAGHRLLVIDDSVRLERYHADCILNQNVNAENLRYPCEPYTRPLLGTRYALLRSEFRDRIGFRRDVSGTARRILVTLGGGDTGRETAKVVEALGLVRPKEVEAAITGGFSNARHERVCCDSPADGMILRLLDSTAGMSQWMAWADIAVCAGGGTCWEMAFMGLPGVVLMLAENQRVVAEGLSQRGICVNLGPCEKVGPGDIASALSELIHDPERRKSMSRLGQELVDGLGAQRVISALLE